MFNFVFKGRIIRKILGKSQTILMVLGSPDEEDYPHVRFYVRDLELRQCLETWLKPDDVILIEGHVQRIATNPRISGECMAFDFVAEKIEFVAPYWPPEKRP